MKSYNARVSCNGVYAGKLRKLIDPSRAAEYEFVYDSAYLADSSQPPVSMTLPKRAEKFSSPVLFPFFCGLLAEGRIKEIQCRNLKIDESDFFSRLLETAQEECIGAVTVEPTAFKEAIL